MGCLQRLHGWELLTWNESYEPILPAAQCPEGICIGAGIQAREPSLGVPAWMTRGSLNQNVAPFPGSL